MSSYWKPPPQPWSIIDQGRCLRIGDRRYALGDITGYETAETIEPNIVGHLMAVGLFMSIGAGFAVPVLMSLSPAKFLVGAILFIAIGATALSEIVRARAIHLFIVDIRLRSGVTVRFSSDQRAQMNALAAALAGHAAA